MRQLKILNKKEIKSLLEMIDKQWGTNKLSDFVYITNKKGKVYITKREVFDIDQSKIRIDSLGLYFGQIFEHQMRLSVEGSQILGPLAKKGVIEVNCKQKSQWMKGEDFSYEHEDTGFVIIKDEKDFLGCGRIKDNVLKNYYPKSRRIQS